MNYALLILLMGAQINIEAFATMQDCEIRRAKLDNETVRSRCLWIQGPKSV